MNIPARLHTRTAHLSEGPGARLWHVGAIRVIVLAIVALGAYTLAGDLDPLLYHLLGLFYVLGLASCLLYHMALRRSRTVRPLLTWAQVLVDFGIVAATVSFTGGATSLFAFLFVIVILEAGLLMGPVHGFVYASLASLFIMIQLAFPPVGIFSDGFARLWYDDAMLNHVYSFFVQTLAFYLTAAISGYWNQRLNRIQQFQHEILDNMNDGFLITDKDGILTAQNEAADRLFEAPKGATLGRPVAEILVPADGGECPLMTAIRTGSDYTRYEFTADVAGQSKVLALTTSHILEGRGRVRSIIAALADVTELAAMREELQRQDRMAVVGELSASLAHEIRNPIAAIRGALEELTRNMETPAVAEQLAAIAIRESDQLNYIISEFLEFAREPTPVREALNAGVLAEDVGAHLREIYRDREGISVHTRIRVEDCPLAGDQAQLKQACVNIGKNAIEAMESDGTLTISVDRDPASVFIRFEDDGPGIPPEQMTRVFEPFYTTKEKGVGMGLAICMRIITAHNGTIRPALREEGGTCMTIRLPAARHGE